MSTKDINSRSNENLPVIFTFPSHFHKGNFRRWRGKRLLILIIFLFALVFGFLLNIFTYKSLNFEQVRFAFAHLPKQWDEFRNGQALYGFVASATIAEWDKPQLLNLKLPFKWLLNNESLCRVYSKENLTVVPVLVHTARSHFLERLAIRKAWGSTETTYFLMKNLTVIQPVFLLGQGDPDRVSKIQLENEHRELTEEQEKFGDLVLGNFVDTYQNLSYKHLMGYKWILNFCQDADFVMKVDDDIFVDIIQWLEWRNEDLKKKIAVPSLYCYTHGGATPRRDPKDKWFVPQDIYADNFYPDYCMGWAYAVSLGFIKQIYAISNFAKFFWVDDVFVTGTLREVAREWFKYDPIIKHVWQGTSEGNDFKEYCDENGNYLEENRYFKAVVSLPRGEHFERLMKCAWNKVLHDHEKQRSLSGIRNENQL